MKMGRYHHHTRRRFCTHLTALPLGAASITNTEVSHNNLNSSESYWSSFGLDATNSAKTQASGPIDGTNVSWTVDTNDNVTSSPAVVNGTTYIGSMDTNLYALAADTGDLEWQFETGGGVVSSPAVADSVVYVGGLDGYVYAIDADTGEEIWRVETDDEVVSSPTVVDGIVYIGGLDEHVYAIEADSGEVAWRTDTAGEVWSTPAVSTGLVYVGTRGQVLHAFSTANGTEQWRFEANDWIEAPPAVDSDTVYVGSIDGVLHALDTQSGEENWNYEIGAAIASSVAVDDSHVYVGSDNGSVTAIDIETEAEAWQYETDDRVFSSPAVTESTVYVGSFDGNVYGLTVNDGRERWRFETDGPISSSPAIYSDKLYIGSGDNSIYAIEQNGDDSSSTGSPITAQEVDERNEWTVAALLLASLGAVGAGTWLYSRSQSTVMSEKEAISNAELNSSDSQHSASNDTTQRPLAPIVLSNAPSHIPTSEPKSISYDDISIRNIIVQSQNYTIYQVALSGDSNSEPLTLWEPKFKATVEKDAASAIYDGFEIWNKLDNHDHIASVIDYGREPFPWLVSEPVNEETLADRSGELTLPETIWTAISITKAVHHAHRRGVSHPQLTPQQILFRSVDDAWDIPKVTGWGIPMRQISSGDTDPIHAQYAAPEQRGTTNGPEDDITDVYRLGMIFYQLFTGELPSREVTDGTVDLDEAPQPPTEVAATNDIFLPPALDDILLQALSYDRSERFDSVIYLRDALRQLSETDG